VKPAVLRKEDYKRLGEKQWEQTYLFFGETNFPKLLFRRLSKVQIGFFMEQTNTLNIKKCKELLRSVRNFILSNFFKDDLKAQHEIAETFQQIIAILDEHGSRDRGVKLGGVASQKSA